MQLRLLSATDPATQPTIAELIAAALATKKDEKRTLFITGGSSVKFWMEPALAAAGRGNVGIFLTDTFSEADALAEGRQDTNEDEVLKAGLAAALGRQRLAYEQVFFPDWRENDPAKVAQSYSSALIRFRGVPYADVVILSSGGGVYSEGGPVDPGHVAGLPHGQAQFQDTLDPFVVVKGMFKPPKTRVSMAPRLIQSAKLVLLFIMGEKKRNAFDNVMDESAAADVVGCPARIIYDMENAFVVTDLV